MGFWEVREDKLARGFEASAASGVGRELVEREEWSGSVGALGGMLDSPRRALGLGRGSDMIYERRWTDGERGLSDRRSSSIGQGKAAMNRTDKNRDGDGRVDGLRAHTQTSWWYCTVGPIR